MEVGLVVSSPVHHINRVAVDSLNHEQREMKIKMNVKADIDFVRQQFIPHTATLPRRDPSCGGFPAAARVTVGELVAPFQRPDIVIFSKRTNKHTLSMLHVIVVVVSS